MFHHQVTTTVLAMIAQINKIWGGEIWLDRPEVLE